MPSPDKQSKGANYLKYSGLAFQIALTIFLCGYVGNKLDLRMQNERPYLTLALSLFGLIGSMLYLIRKVGKGI